MLVFFFFQAGGLQLMPVSVEITYGLERILMLLQVIVDLLFISHHHFTNRYISAEACPLLQGVDHFKKIQYADGITYGELFAENE